MLDDTVGGSLISKSAEDAITIIRQMTLSDQQGQHSKNQFHKKNGIIEINTNDVSLAQNKFLTQTVDKLTKQLLELLH